ncbi:MAG TPA: TIR domain-containing protein [Rhodanobacteraceae bacterium]|nr:TIR domain-containing protein [Rhodanobacteraceae bacterium]
MLDFRYRAFLCYSHRDSDWADWLHHAIEDYPIPPRLVGLTTSAGVIPARLAPVFRDRDELPSATDLSAKVSDALAQSANLIVICSPHAAQSHWVNEEVRAFQRLGRAQRIFCLIVDGEPGASEWAGREHDECIAPALTHRVDASGRETGERFEPIAADARPGKDGRSNARTKIVAGLLGVDLDDLRHRERRRRRLRGIAAIAAGFVLLCLTTTLAVNAVIARHAAERRQKQAEDLVGFMLGDLDDKLRQVNRLDILESVSDKVVKYFAALPAADITDGAIAQRTRAQLKLGAVRRDQGRVQEAYDTFKSALATSEELVRRAPANTEYETIHAESLTWVGYVDWSQGRLDDALSRFGAARDALVRVSAERPDDTDILDRIASVRTNVGRIYEARGRTEEARAEYAKVLDGYAYLSRREPDTLGWKTELGYAHNNLAQLALKEGKLEEAVREYVADRDIKVKLFELDPSNNARREDLVAAEAFLGRALYLCGETPAAATHLRAAMKGIEALLRIDPESTDWLDKAGSYGWMMGQVSRALGDGADAERRDEQAIARLGQLVRKDATNVGWQRKLAQAHLENARRLLALAQSPVAGEALGAAKQALDRALAGAADDLTNQLVGAQLQLALGDVADAGGDAAKARAAWSAAGFAMKAPSQDPAALHVAIGARLRLGEDAEAVASARQLAATGYREADFIAMLARHGVEVPEASPVRERIAQLARQPGDAETKPD